MASLVLHGRSEIPEIIEIQESETVRQFLTRLGEVDVEILSVSIRDREEDLELEAVLIGVVEDGHHVHVARHCKHIAVKVRYGGPPYKHKAFKSNSTVLKVLQWSESEYKIPQDQRGQFRLKHPNAEGYLENDEILGDIVKEQPCELRVDLVRTEQNAGSE